MAVKIRLKRIGAKKNPYYRIVVADARYPRDGRFIEQIGSYDPMTNPAKVSVDGIKALQWMKNGAQPTDTVRSLLKKTGALEKAKEELQKRKFAEEEAAANALLTAKTVIETEAAVIKAPVEFATGEIKPKENEIAESGNETYNGETEKVGEVEKNDEGIESDKTGDADIAIGAGDANKTDESVNADEAENTGEALNADDAENTGEALNADEAENTGEAVNAEEAE